MSIDTSSIVGNRAVGSGGGILDAGHLTLGNSVVTGNNVPDDISRAVVFLSTDAGSYSGLGALRFAERTPFHVVAAINLDGIGGHGGDVYHGR